MKRGAFACVQTPVESRVLLATILEALAKAELERDARRRQEEVMSRFRTLTPREREVRGWSGGTHLA